ncbi:unnamed protein product, partial [Prorocentrum cordatum]
AGTATPMTRPERKIYLDEMIHWISFALRNISQSQVDRACRQARLWCVHFAMLQRIMVPAYSEKLKKCKGLENGRLKIGNYHSFRKFAWGFLLDKVPGTVGWDSKDADDDEPGADGADGQGDSGAAATLEAEVAKQLKVDPVVVGRCFEVIKTRANIQKEIGLFLKDNPLNLLGAMHVAKRSHACLSKILNSLWAEVITVGTGGFTAIFAPGLTYMDTAKAIVTTVGKVLLEYLDGTFVQVAQDLQTIGQQFGQYCFSTVSPQLQLLLQAFGDADATEKNLETFLSLRAKYAIQCFSELKDMRAHVHQAGAVGGLDSSSDGPIAEAFNCMESSLAFLVHFGPSVYVMDASHGTSMESWVAGWAGAIEKTSKVAQQVFTPKTEQEWAKIGQHARGRLSPMTKTDQLAKLGEGERTTAQSENWKKEQIIELLVGAIVEQQKEDEKEVAEEWRKVASDYSEHVRILKSKDSQDSNASIDSMLDQVDSSVGGDSKFTKLYSGAGHSPETSSNFHSIDAAAKLTSLVHAKHSDYGCSELFRAAVSDTKLLNKPCPKVFAEFECVPRPEDLVLTLTGKVTVGDSAPVSKNVYAAGSLLNGDKLFIHPSMSAVLPRSPGSIPGWFVRPLRSDSTKPPTMVPRNVEM